MPKTGSLTAFRRGFHDHDYRAGDHSLPAPVLLAGQSAKAIKYNKTRLTIGISINSPSQPGYPVRRHMRHTGTTTTIAINTIHSQCPAHIMPPDMFSFITVLISFSNRRYQLWSG